MRAQDKSCPALCGFYAALSPPPRAPVPYSTLFRTWRAMLHLGRRSVDILRLEGQLKLVNSRLQNGLTHLQRIGQHYQYVMLPNEPPGPNREAINDLITELFQVQHLLTHDDQVIIAGGVPLLE